MKTGYVPTKPSDKGSKGITPNKMQRQPNVAKPSPPVKFNLYRSQGK